MSLRLAATTSCFVLLSCASALSEDISAKSSIRDVTVYPDGAEITRIAEASVPSGASTLVFKGLPANIDPSSIRISGESTTSISLGSVETLTTPVNQVPVSRPNEIDAKIKSLLADRSALAAKDAAYDTEIAMVKRFSQANPIASTAAGATQAIGVKEWPAAFEAIYATIATASGQQSVVKTQIHDLDAQISELEIQKTPPVLNGTTVDARVSIDSDAASHAKFTLSYRVGNASWRPIYDARLDTKKGSLELVRRTEVRQATGEDWNDVALSVSTTKTSGRTSAPSIDPLFLSFVEPANAMRSKTMSLAGNYAESDAFAPAQRMVGGAAPAAAPIIARENTATLSYGAFSASFAIPGKISISGDSAPRSFRINSQTSSPELAIRIIPSIDPTAYLEAHVVNKDDAPLLPGQVNLFRDGAYSGKAQIGQTAAAEAFDLGFGADDSVKVTRVPLNLVKSDPTWYARSTNETSDFKTTIKNLHAIPLKIVVNDRVPVARNYDIKVDVLSETTPPSQDVDDKVGVYDWTFDLAPGASKAIRLAYKVSWPAGKVVAYPR